MLITETESRGVSKYKKQCYTVDAIKGMPCNYVAMRIIIDHQTDRQIERHGLTSQNRVSLSRCSPPVSDRNSVTIRGQGN